MKTVTLLRHAKSSWDDAVSRDFDRPLNGRGHRAARTVGREMRALGLAFDHVLASPAERVVETIAGVAEGYGRTLAPLFDKRIYLAAPTTLMDLIQQTPAEAARLLLIGHNPGLEGLALMLTEGDDTPLRDELAMKYPTATLAEISFAVNHWEEVDEGGGTLARFIRPRDLDPELGPDGD